MRDADAPAHIDRGPGATHTEDGTCCAPDGGAAGEAPITTCGECCAFCHGSGIDAHGNYCGTDTPAPGKGESR